MTFQPMAEDLIYVLNSDGDRFSAHDRRTLENEIAKALERRGDNGASGTEGTVMNAWANRWVELGGNEGQPLTESPIPPEPGDGDILDPDFAAACVECRSNEPCCFMAGTISDSTDSSRQLSWPRVFDSEEQCFLPPHTLLVVAKEQDGMHLAAKVQVEWEGQPCREGHVDRPRLTTSGLTDGRDRIEEHQVEVATGYYTMPSMALALRQYVPENVLHALFAMDAVLAIASTIQGAAGATFTPMQCATDSAMSQSYRVIPLHYAKLDGKLELASHIAFTTAGVTASAKAKGSLTGQYGSFELTAKGEAGGEANTGQAVDSGGDAPGLVGAMARIIGTLDEYVGKGNEQRRPLDRTQYASGIRLTKSLTFEPTGVELTAITGSPDLQLDIGSLTSTFSMGVSGKLDFIDALATVVAPVAPAIREARARMAEGKNVKAKLQADLQVAATGSLAHSIGSGARIRLPANGGMHTAWEGIQQQFGGELRVNAKAELVIQVSTGVWIFKAKAGASGSLHTSWCWAMRLHEGERQRSYAFEGVVLTLTAYAEVEFESKDEEIKQTGLGLGGEHSTETQVGDLFEHVEQHIADSRAEAEQMAQQRPDTDAPEDGTNTFTIWQPVEPQWQAY